MFRRALRLGLGPGLPYRGLRTRKGGFTLGKAEGSSGSGEPKPSIDVTFKTGMQRCLTLRRRLIPSCLERNMKCCMTPATCPQNRRMWSS
uniref:FAD-dependent oxidoreductase domain containing 1 n=1 Tax=Mus musculus TaxID=10090 RepID=D6RCV5_MOUSE